MRRHICIAWFMTEQKEVSWKGDVPSMDPVLSAQGRMRVPLQCAVNVSN